MRFVSVVAAIVLVAAIVPFVSDDSSAYTLQMYDFQFEESSEGEYSSVAIFDFEEAPSSTPTLKYYSNSSCTSLIAEAVLDIVTDEVHHEFVCDLSNPPSVVYAKLLVGSQFSIYQVTVSQDAENGGSESVTSFVLSNADVSSVSVSDSVYTFTYVWYFDDGFSGYTPTASIYSDSDCSELVASVDDYLTCGSGDDESVYTSVILETVVSSSDFYLKFGLGTQSWVSHVVFSVSEDDPSTVNVDTNEVEDTSEDSDNASLIFDSADTLMKVLLVLGAVLVVVFVVFGFGVRNTRRSRR